MKIFHGKSRGRRQRMSAQDRAEILAAFEQSGQSAAAFARRYGLNYTTFRT
jgi:transposase-like protein